jgi:hypothetical protein
VYIIKNKGNNTMNKKYKGCYSFNRIPRRDTLTFGSLGALGMCLGDFLTIRAKASDSSLYNLENGNNKLPENIKSIIQLNLGGGFPQHESFDPKPEAPVDIRGYFGVVKTKNGEILSDNFPQTAKISDKITVIRTVVGKIPDHGLASYHLSTGYVPTPVIDYPTMGSIISHELGDRGLLPPYIAIPQKNSFSGNSGFLSSNYGVFELGADPAKGKDFKVKDFSLPPDLSLDRFDRRQTARKIIEQRLRSLEANIPVLETMDSFYSKAYELLTSSDAQNAFSFDQEKEETFELYGSQTTGRVKGPDGRYHPKGLAERLIIARRLVEAGVRFITINYGSWDCHTGIKECCDDWMPSLDHAIHGLVTDLDQRGLLDSTLLWVTSEFGRTPKINKDSGRDHHSRCYSMLLAGGSFNRGLFYGASDSVGNDPSREAVSLEDLMFTIYHELGIDANKELVAFGTRPIEIIKDGKLVKDLIS